MSLGPIEEELAKARSAYRNWGRWGEDDVLGTLNFIDDAIRAHAAGLVRRGRSFSLSQEFNEGVRSAVSVAGSTPSTT